MRLEGIHHITAITGDAPRNVDFYGRVLGLRLVKKTVNQDDPTVYHLFYADELGSPGADITFFEYPGARRGRAGAGMVHRVVWRVADEDALGFWEQRLGDEGVETERSPGRLRFDDPEGLGLELAVVETPDKPLISQHPDVPNEVALQGFDGVRAYTRDPQASRGFLGDSLDFRSSDGETYEARGDERGSFYAFDRTGRARAARRRHDPPRRLGLDHGRPRRLAGPGDGRRSHAHTGHRPLLLQVDLLS